MTTRHIATGPRGRARVAATAAALALAFTASGCGADDGGADAGSGTAGGASDGTSATSGEASGSASGEPNASASASPSGGASAASPTGPAAIPVTPPEEAVQLTNACTGEGAYVLPASGAEPVSPALPERSGSTLALTVTEVEQSEGGAAVRLSATIGSEEPRAVDAARVGDTFAVGDWTLSVTSICADQVELDLID